MSYFKTVTSRPNAYDVQRNDKDTSLLLKWSQCPGKPSWFRELCLESQLMLASVETREKCPESLYATPFILLGDVIITHTLEYSALGGGKPTETCNCTIFLLSREGLSRPHLIWLEARQGGRHPRVFVMMRNYHLWHPFRVHLHGTDSGCANIEHQRHRASPTWGPQQRPQWRGSTESSIKRGGISVALYIYNSVDSVDSLELI